VLFRNIIFGSFTREKWESSHDRDHCKRDSSEIINNIRTRVTRKVHFVGVVYTITIEDVSSGKLMKINGFLYVALINEIDFAGCISHNILHRCTSFTGWIRRNLQMRTSISRKYFQLNPSHWHSSSAFKTEIISSSVWIYTVKAILSKHNGESIIHFEYEITLMEKACLPDDIHTFNWTITFYQCNYI